tara:strand:- start:278 stop:1585 length:1308 start_codon:yes stop_codon:yes gene_type:complete
MLEDTSRYNRVDASTYASIESAIICNLDEERLKRFPYAFSHFSVHGEAFEWLRKFLETYKKVPTISEIELTYPTIDITTVGLTWDYVVEIFKKQVIWRSAENCIKSAVSQLQTDPQKGIIDLISKLTDVTFDFDTDITIYDDGSVRRLEEYEEDRRKYLENGGIVGIPTPFKALQNLGSGWKPGELIGIFARSGIGKSWLCTELAAIAALSGTRTLFISPEMTVKQLSLRLDTIIGHKLGYAFLHSDLANLKPIENKEEYVKFLQENNARTQAICHSTMGENGLTIQSIKNLIRRYNPQFVIIDGIYLIGSDTATASQHTWERSNDLTTAFKNIAVQQNVAVCVSTQANRENPDEFMPPAANTVAFGDGLLKAADYLFSMSKTLDSNGDYDERLRKVKCLKVRDGALLPGNIIFRWDVNRGDIEELENYEFTSDY